MESYIIIISATIAAVGLIYEISKKLKTKLNNNITSIVKVDNNSGFSFPVGVPNDLNNNIINNTNDTTKIYFKVKEINNNDIDAFTKIATNIDWYNIVNNIINNVKIEQLNYLLTSDITLHSSIVLQCTIESIPPRDIFIHIDKNLIITIKTE